MNEMQETVQKQMYDVYHASNPVIKALKELIKALEDYKLKTMGWPPLLGLEHYRYALKEVRKHRIEARETAEGLSHVCRTESEVNEL